MAAAMLTIPDCVDEIGPAAQLHRQAKKVPLGSRQRGKVLVGAEEQGGERPGLSAFVAASLSVPQAGAPFCS